MIDTHTHLTSLEDPDGAIIQARAAGLKGLVTVGMTIETNESCLVHAHEHSDFVRVAVGIHPQQAQHFDLVGWKRVRELAADDAVCAIGETGWDRFRDYGPLGLQQHLFELHAELARDLTLPLVIHTRAAQEHTMAALAAVASDVTIVMHCFSMPDQLDDLLAMGCYISFAGNVTYPSAVELQNAAKLVPNDRLLIETDAPYLTPQAKRKVKNTPAYVAYTADFLAQLRGVAPTDLARQTTKNAWKLFGFGAVKRQAD